MPSDFLETIYAAKAKLLERERAREAYDLLRARALATAGERRSFLAALRRASGPAIIAEIKRASPSAGVIAPACDVSRIAGTYEAAGACAISVLTESDRFLGDLAHLRLAREATTLPILRKDFMWTRYHVAQSAAHGADCMLLILAGITDDMLAECVDEARRYALDLLVEVHDGAELRRANDAGAALIGVNNRNLRTLAIDLGVGESLLPKVSPHAFAVSESGIRKASDVARLRRAGARGFLIGETLLRAADPARAIQALIA